MTKPSTARRAGWVLLLVLSGSVATFFLREPILRRIGAQLVREDSLQRADAIVVLAGATPLREIEAADLYRAGYAPVVLLTLENDEPSIEVLRERGITFESRNQQRVRIMRLLGVPESALTVLDATRAVSTKSEAELVRGWASEHHPTRLIVVTSSFHTRRASMVFRRVLRGLGVELLMRPASRDPFHVDTWWRDRDQLRNGIFEWQKLVFYSVAYR